MIFSTFSPTSFSDDISLPLAPLALSVLGCIDSKPSSRWFLVCLSCLCSFFVSTQHSINFS
eukprot:m.115047 g.115047  ORF g.115047 m.115047 type:complete len:61 (-) comp14439_c1_seq1:14-196(-)